MCAVVTDDYAWQTETIPQEIFFIVFFVWNYVFCCILAQFQRIQYVSSREWSPFGQLLKGTALPNKLTGWVHEPVSLVVTPMVVSASSG